MNKKISIICGDLRLVYLANIWQQDGFEVYTYGLEKSSQIADNFSIAKCDTLNRCIESSDIIISSMPFTNDDIYIKESFSNEKVKIEELTRYLKEKTFIAGNIPEKFYELIQHKNIKVIDLMKNEELAILNSISTVEGAIKIAIEETNETIHGSNILILGFGRIGKILAKTLSGMGANVFCEARKMEDLAWITTYGYNKIPLKNLSENLSKFNIIFNTIPNIILDAEKLKLIKKYTLIIDLASKPGGVEQEAAKDLGLKMVWALAIPGKIAPKSAAKIIKQTIEHELR